METEVGRAGRGVASSAVRVVLIVLGSALAANAAWLALTANFTVGTAMAGLAALGFLAWGIWWPRLRHRRLLNASAILLCLAVIGLSGFLAGFGVNDDIRYDEDALIVLGAAVHGRELSRTLTARLDTAFAYHQRNQGALIVVSGGQGPQEDLPESVAMQQYLVGRGVPAASIVVEDRSTSTEENFAFSKALLDQRLPEGYTVAFVTNEFHVYRAGLIAAGTGLSARHVASRTPWYFWPTNYLRENLAVVTMWVTGMG